MRHCVLTFLFPIIAPAVAVILLTGCGSGKRNEKMDATEVMAAGTFGHDLAFLRQYHKDLILLGDDSSLAQLIVLPAYQGRVMTSTAEGHAGTSFGWINHELIRSGKFTPHFSAFGGEERFWIGPEGGQFSIYFRPGSAFSFDAWQVPGVIDTLPFDLVHADRREAVFTKKMQLLNHSGTRFDLQVDRRIRIMDEDSIRSIVGDLGADIKWVGFSSENSITNTGAREWNRETGMLSIWILSMLQAGDDNTIAIPYRQGDSVTLGKIVTDDYFGKVPLDRLRVSNGLIRMKADGNHRSKIGLSPKRALPVAGSYDARRGLLTIAQFSMPETEKAYVNSLWEMQDDPFNGDAVNAYNDGPVDGAQMGKFYEIESSSPAAALAPGKSLWHMHRTVHFSGPKGSLDKIARKLLGAGLDDIRL